MEDKDKVAPQVTDGVTQANVTAIGSTPSYALAQTTLSFAQSQGVLLANMVSDQQRQSMAGSAAMVKSIQHLLGDDDSDQKKAGGPETGTVVKNSKSASGLEEELTESFTGPVSDF